MHTKGPARFAISFVPLEAMDHIINTSVKKEFLSGPPFTVKINTPTPTTFLSPGSVWLLQLSDVGMPSLFTLSNLSGGIEDN